MSAPQKLPHIIVVGGGAGGLELVTGLGHKLGKHKKAIVTLVDYNLTHIWKPLLHEVAAGTLNASQNEISYLTHAAKNHYQFELGRFVNLNRENKTITLGTYHNAADEQLIAQRTLSYDYLVIAVGSECNDFNTPGANEYCDFLENCAQAEHFHQQLLDKLFKIEHAPGDINIAIIGAGATGVELAAELQYTLSHVQQFGFKNINPANIHLSLIEGGPRILTALPAKVSAATTDELKNLNINVLTNERVEKVTAQGVYTSSGTFIPATMKVWAAGIKAPNFLTQLDGLKTNKINQLLVQQNLQTTCDAAIFAMGDCASIPQPKSALPVPALAQAAHQEAKVLCKSFSRLLKGKSLLNFTFHYRGSLISLSRYTSIGYLMGRLPGRLHLEGKIARFLYLLLYKIHQKTLIGYWRTVVSTLSNLLTRKIRPRLKLH